MQRRSIGPEGAERLGRIPLFEGVSEGQRRMLARLVDEVHVPAGEMIMRQGEHGYEFMLVEQGQAEVTQDGEPIRALDPGDFCGELAILGDGTPRSACVLARTDVVGLVFTAHFLREIRERLPLVGERIDRVARERVERDSAARSGSEPRPAA